MQVPPYASRPSAALPPYLVADLSDLVLLGPSGSSPAFPRIPVFPMPVRTSNFPRPLDTDPFFFSLSEETLIAGYSVMLAVGVRLFIVDFIPHPCLSIYLLRPILPPLFFFPFPLPPPVEYALGFCSEFLFLFYDLPLWVYLVFVGAAFSSCLLFLGSSFFFFQLLPISGSRSPFLSLPDLVTF